MQAVGAAKFWMNGRAAVERLRLRSAPMLAAAAMFALGIVAARQWHPPAILAAQTAVLFLLALIALRRAPRLAALVALAFWIALGCWCAQMEPPVPLHRELYPYADGLSREVTGHVVRVHALNSTTQEQAIEPQQPWLAEPGAWEQIGGDAHEAIDLALDNIEDVTPDTSTMRPVSGGLRVTVLGDSLPLHCGDRLAMPLRLRVPDTLRDPGAFSGAQQLAAEGVQLLGTIKRERVEKTGHDTATWQCRFYAAQSWAAARLDGFAASHANGVLPHFLRVHADDAAMLRAMLAGDRTSLTPSLKAGFERTGTFHLFVVSGLHVALLAGALLWMLRRVRLRDGFAIPLTLAMTTLFAVLTGFGEPIQRALLMTAAYLLARLLGRRTTSLQALGIAAVVALAVDPRALFGASFQMTFLVIFAMAALATPLRERSYAPFAWALRNLSSLDLDIYMAPRLAAFRVRLRLWNAVLADLGLPASTLPLALRFAFIACDALLFGVVTECCMALPMAVFFHRTTVWALPVNIVAMPLVGMLLAAAIAAFVLLLLSPWAALPAFALTALGLHAMRFVVDLASRAAGADLRVPSPAPIALALAGCLLLCACWALRERQRALAIAGACAVVLAPLLALWPAMPLLHRDRLEVTALDVGQGDSLLVVTPDGHTLLVDAGGPVGGSVAPSNWDVGEDVVAPYLWSRRIRRLDVVLLTHAHSDHMGGMPAVLRDLRPRELWLSINPGESPALHALENEATTLGIRIRHLHAGNDLEFGGLPVRVLAPEPGYTNPAAPLNNDSLVAELRYGTSRVLLEGDAEASSEADMLADGRLAPVTLLKVGHHGSKTSTTPGFLAAIHPQDAVISVGRHNTFGHPRFDVLATLEAAHVHTYRTDRDGAMTFLLDAEGHVEAMQAAAEE
jgi:competence protein ComEC